tara:strand:- start:125 stop:1000 length:876 start_codon:yes stop_codon:yes gene_type:complete
MKNNNTFIEKFIDYIDNEKRYSKHTITAYSADLCSYIKYLNSHDMYLIDVNSNFIRNWIRFLSQNQKSFRSINRKISTLKSFYKFLFKSKIINFNPMDKIMFVKNKNKIPVFINSSTMEDLFSKIDFSSDFNGVRDKLILDFFYSTGIRLSELIDLKLNDVDLDSSLLKVFGKRNKERLIPFSDNMKKSIVFYISKRESKLPFLFLNKDKKLYPKFVYRLVKKYFAKISSITNISPHKLRHTFATHMLNNGAEINAIKDILGHSNLSSTQVYTHTTIDRLKSVYKKAHNRK